MEVIDMQKLDTALLYIQRITEGKNPVNNMPAEEDSIINNPNVIRCMYFVKDILEEVKGNDGIIGAKASAKKDNRKDYPLEVLDDFKYKEDKAISKFVEQLNEMIDVNEYKKLSFNAITKWLKESGYLEVNQRAGSNRKETVPTAKGLEIGIKGEKRSNFDGIEYTYITYNQQAQEFIVKHMGEIL